MSRLGTIDFIERSISKHGDKYDYTISSYINTRTKIKVICPQHGCFEQLPKSHYNGQGCPRCYGNLNLSKKEFISMCDESRYDYSLLPEIIRIKKTTIDIIDRETNLIYRQWPSHHINKIKPTKIESNSLVKKLKEVHDNEFDYIIEKDCYYSKDKIKIVNMKTGDESYYLVYRHLSGMKPNKITINLFITKSNLLHNNKYDYSLVNNIKGGDKKVNIICKEHGIFSQRVSNHMNLGDGCPGCSGIRKWNNDILKSEFRKVHSDRYDYSNLNFTFVKNKIEIICREHGSFHQSIYKHLRGQGCPECSSNSNGEEYVKMFLEELEIKYIRQHGFDTCKYVNKLSFDFYLPEQNVCIEFDGIQHFKPVKQFGGEEEFNDIKERDKCKNEWCKNNNVKLIRIKYNEFDNIKNILLKELKNNL